MLYTREHEAQADEPVSTKEATTPSASEEKEDIRLAGPLEGLDETARLCFKVGNIFVWLLLNLILPYLYFTDGA
jgi:hypothetical protein